LRSSGGTSEDDLPSVVLPARLLVQLPHERRQNILLDAASSANLAEALLLDQAAATSGQTLETWAYRAALSALASSRRTQVV